MHNTVGTSTPGAVVRNTRTDRHLEVLSRTTDNRGRCRTVHSQRCSFHSTDRTTDRPLLYRGRGQALHAALIDISDIHPAPQTRLADSEIRRDHSDRLLPRPRELRQPADGTPVSELESSRAPLREAVSPQVVSGLAGQAPAEWLPQRLSAERRAKHHLPRSWNSTAQPASLRRHASSAALTKDHASPTPRIGSRTLTTSPLPIVRSDHSDSGSVLSCSSSS